MYFVLSNNASGHVSTMATDEHAHLTLVTALRVVDDTALLCKSIVQEIVVRCLLCCLHVIGR